MTIRLEGKRPADSRNYEHDWSPFLGEDKIVTSAWEVDGVTKSSEDKTDTGVSIRLSGGTHGTLALLTNTITTLGGNTETEIFRILISDVEEPVSLDLAKQQIEFSADDRDSLIVQKIIAAREWVEDETGLVLVRRTFTEQHRPQSGYIDLYKRPIVDVQSITYLDSSGAQQTFADHQIIGGRLKANIGTYWPSSCDGFEITYEAGLGDGETPQRLVEAILILVAGMFEDREGAYEASEKAARSLCASHRRLSI